MEEWDAKDVGICAQKRLYKVFRSTRRKKCFQELDNEQIHRGPRVTLWKQGSEILNVENITIVTEVGVKKCFTL